MFKGTVTTDFPLLHTNDHQSIKKLISPS